MHPVADDPIAAPIDPGIPQRSFTEKDFEGKNCLLMMSFCIFIRLELKTKSQLARLEVF